MNIKTKPNGIQIICIGCPKNLEFENLIKTYGGKLIDFYSNNLDDLTIIAKYRILPAPTILILSGSKVIARIVRPPKLEQIIDLINDIV